jgi:membrane complex biogenesis BtpA family protein
VIEGRAAETLRLRRALGAALQIWADVHVKHGQPLSHATVAREAEDAVHRGLADAVIVSGPGTGAETDAQDLRAVAALRLGVPIFVGSGLTPENCGALLAIADGAIVGSTLKRGGNATAALDPDRLRSFMAAARAGSA